MNTTPEPLNENRQKSKLALLKKWSQKNFTNRVMYMLAGYDEFFTQEKYKHLRYYIDLAYDLVAPELSMENNQTKPSKALATIAFSGPLRAKDYQNLVEMSKSATSVELRQFLNQEIDHQPTERVIDYMTLPLLAMMSAHLKPWEKVDVLLMKPQIIHDTFSDIRSKTFKELLTESDLMLLRRRVPKALQKYLEIGEVPLTWNVHVTTSTKEGFGSGCLDTRIVQAQGRWPDVLEARKKTPQTGISRQIALWKMKHHIREG